MKPASKFAFRRGSGIPSRTGATVAALTAMIAAALAVADGPPRSAAPGPGTAVVAPGTQRVRYELDQVPAGTYDVVTKETLVRYGVDHFGYSEYWGTFPGATGTLVFDPKSPESTRLDVKIPITLVETTNRELNGELFSDEFFDAENYPWMTFHATHVARSGPKGFSVTGELTMHDVTKPVVLEAVFHGAGNDPFSGQDVIVGFDVRGRVKRSDFGLGKYVPFVSDETTITISAAFRTHGHDPA